MQKLILLILVLLILQACSQGIEKTDGKLLEKTPGFKSYLLAGKWLGTRIEMTGLATSTQERLGYEPLLSFKKNGSCLIEMGEESYKCKWKLADNYLDIKGPGIDSKVYFSWFPRDEYYSLEFYELKNYSIYFYREDYLEEKKKERDAKHDAYIVKMRERTKELRESLSAVHDISQMDDYFLRYLDEENFEEFKLIDFNEGSRQKLMDRFFPDLLGLGLAERHWIHTMEEIDPILDAYEAYVFNASFSQEEREARDGELVQVPVEKIKDYIGSRLNIYRKYWDPSNQALYFTGDVYKESQRYFWGGYEMEIKKEDPPEILAHLQDAWKKDGKYVIHLVYDLGQEEGHGWYMLEEVEGEDYFKFIRGTYESRR